MFEANSHDGLLNSSCRASLAGDVDNNELRLAGTTAPGSGDAITQVRARVNGATVKFTGPEPWHTVIAEIFDGATSLGTPFADSEWWVQKDQNEWGNYVILDEPVGGWTWAKLGALEAICYGTNTDPFYKTITVIELHSLLETQVNRSWCNPLMMIS